MTTAILAIAGFALLTLIAMRGRGADRAAVGIVIIGSLITPAVDGHIWQGVRWGVTFVDLIVLLTLFTAANRDDRWWLLNLCALQVLTLMTHVAPLFGADYLVSTAVTIRLFIWGAILFSLAAAVAEIEADRRFPETRHATI